jgi:hypothetical protein
MAELPVQNQPTIDLIYKGYVDRNPDFRRAHLGASLIGKECERCLWYDFRWATDPKFDGRMLRLFETGQKEEARIIDNLRSVGLEIYDREPDTGKQMNYSEPLFGHFGGSLDGIGIKFPEALKTWHVLELKTSSKKLFEKLLKEGVEKAKPQHYAQVQVYMRWSKLERAMYIVYCKDDDRMYCERIYYDKDFAEQLVEKARRVIYSAVPLERLGSNINDFRCKFCDHIESCWGKSLPLVSCRTCAHVTPLEDGTWECGLDKTILSESKQKTPCERHIFIPNLVPLEMIGSDPEKGTIEYEGGIINGPGAIRSSDLYEKGINNIKSNSGKSN